MEDFAQIAAGAVAAVVVALAPVARRVALALIADAEARAKLAVQQRLGEAAGRVAATIAANLENGQASAATVDAAAMEMAVRFRETLAAHQVPPPAVASMVAGELAKLGVQVVR